jgi:agmatine deiminase
MIRQSGLDYVEIPWFEVDDKKNPLSAVGCYVNYLEVGNLILFPVFGVKGNHDEEAVEIITEVFPDRIIETININDIANEGGLLNCVSWTIKK